MIKFSVNTGHAKDENDIYLPRQIEKVIKPHQIGGVRLVDIFVFIDTIMVKKNSKLVKP